jgi:hypothetical protein
LQNAVTPSLAPMAERPISLIFATMGLRAGIGAGARRLT